MQHDSITLPYDLHEWMALVKGDPMYARSRISKRTPEYLVPCVGNQVSTVVGAHVAGQIKLFLERTSTHR